MRELAGADPTGNLLSGEAAALGQSEAAVGSAVKVKTSPAESSTPVSVQG